MAAWLREVSPTMTIADHVSTPDPPWVQLIVLGSGRRLALGRGLPAGFVVRVVDGRRCRTEAACLAELARVLEFPAYFGLNWDALEECLTDLEWLPARGYVLGFRRADQLLGQDATVYATLIAILAAAGQEWARPRQDPPRPALPFHTVLAVSARRRHARADWRVPIVEGPR